MPEGNSDRYSRRRKHPGPGGETGPWVFVSRRRRLRECQFDIDVEALVRHPVYGDQIPLLPSCHFVFW